MDEKTITVGSVVHYVSYGTPGGEYQSQCRAAVIAEVTEDQNEYAIHAALVVLNPSGNFYNTCLRDETDFAGGTWHTIETCTMTPRYR